MTVTMETRAAPLDDRAETLRVGLDWRDAHHELVPVLKALEEAVPEAELRLSPAAAAWLAREVCGSNVSLAGDPEVWLAGCGLLLLSHAAELEPDLFARVSSLGLPVITRGPEELAAELGRGALVLPPESPWEDLTAAAVRWVTDRSELENRLRLAQAHGKRLRGREAAAEARSGAAALSGLRFGRRFPPPENRLVLRAALDAVTGYGQHALHTIRQLRRLGVEVRVEPLWIWEDPCPLPADIRPHLRPGPEGEAWELLLGVPMEDPPTDRARVRFTMWESGRLPAGCVERLNSSAAVLVPCRWNQLCFDAAGVRVPLHRVPMGLDPEVFSPRSWPAGPFTFGAGGRLSHGGVRKGVAQVAWAFHRAFPPDEEVRLQLKVHGDCDLQALPPDPRITLLRESWNERQMARWFGGLHVYVTMAAAEGFGFMPLQAMACGRPVIAAIEHGHAEYMTPETVLEVPAGLTRAELEAGPRWEYAGYWFPPEEEAVIARMRECYAADPADLQTLGSRAAAQASRFTWDRYGEGLVGALREVGVLAASQN